MVFIANLVLLPALKKFDK